MQTQRRTLLKTANKLYRQGKRIQWKIVDTDYRPFADGELVLAMSKCLTICHVNDKYFRLHLVTKARGIEYSFLFLWARHYLCYRHLARIFCFK